MAQLLLVGSQGEEPIELLGRQTIGREPSCDIVFLRDSVSRRHALLTTEVGSTTIEDLESTNGTFVNSERVRSRVLADGDQIRIGDQVLVFAAGQEFLKQTREFDSYAELRVDEATRRVWRAGQELSTRLTPQEFVLLSYLIKRRGKVCSRDEIGDAVWGAGGYDGGMLHQLVRRLRAKIELAPSNPKHIITVPRVGYKLE